MARRALMGMMGMVVALSLSGSFGTSQAAILVESTFDAGNEGWTVGDFFVNSGSATPTFLAAGGNPGGFIRTNDLFGWNGYHAPAAFLGNQSAAYGGIFHVDQRILSSDGVDYPMVVLSDGTTSLQFRTTPPTTDWTPYDISLLASAGWEIADGSGNPIPHTTFLIGQGHEFKVPADQGGYLYCFANDAWQAYGNNSGSVSLTVKRTA